MNEPVEVEFVGGPADGSRRYVEVEHDGNPALIIGVDVMGVPSPEDEVVPVTWARYLRRLSPRDEGVLWQYIYVPPEPPR